MSTLPNETAKRRHEPVIRGIYSPKSWLMVHRFIAGGTAAGRAGMVGDVTDDPIRKARREQSKAHPRAREMMEAMLPQLLIVLVARLGGDIAIAVADVDATGDRNLAMSVDQKTKTFTFKVVPK